MATLNLVLRAQHPANKPYEQATLAQTKTSIKGRLSLLHQRLAHTSMKLLAYNLCMTQRSIELLEQALSLTEEERADLVASLLNSLDASPDPDAESLWQEEISRRAADLDSGKAKTVPWQDVQSQASAVLQHGQKRR